MSGRILLVCAVIAVPCLPESVDASNSEFVPAAAIPCAPLTDLKRSNAWEDLSVWLHTAPFQPLFALGATLAGLLCVWDGPALWHVLFTASSALAACGFAHSEARNSDFDEVSALFVAIFTGAAVGLAAHVGFDGSQVFVGVILGMLGGYGVGAGTDFLGVELPGLAEVWSCAGGLVGLLVFTAWRRPALSTLVPLFGGLLVTSGVGYLARRVFDLLAILDDEAAPGAIWLPRSETWVRSMSELVGGGAATTVLALQCVCALGSTFLFELKGSRVLAIPCLCAGILLSPFFLASGAGCDEGSCLDYLITGEWRWLFLGSLLWAAVVAIAAWRQLGRVYEVPLPDLPVTLPFTTQLPPDYALVDGHNAVPTQYSPPEREPAHQEGVGAFSTFFATRLPSTRAQW